MTTAATILATARAHGVEVVADGDRLHLRAAHRPPTDLTDAIAANKPAILSALASRDHHGPRAIVLFALSDAPDAWPVCIGAPGETHDDVIANLRRRYADRLIEARRAKYTQEAQT